LFQPFKSFKTFNARQWFQTFQAFKRSRLLGGGQVAPFNAVTSHSIRAVQVARS